MPEVGEHLRQAIHPDAAGGLRIRLHHASALDRRVDLDAVVSDILRGPVEGEDRLVPVGVHILGVLRERL
jgi:hypothetical protein